MSPEEDAYCRTYRGVSVFLCEARRDFSRVTAAESPFRLSAEEWTQDVAPLIRQKVAERVAGIVATGDAKKSRHH
jgi:hypothetical protein